MGKVEGKGGYMMEGWGHTEHPQRPREFPCKGFHESSAVWVGVGDGGNGRGKGFGFDLFCFCPVGKETFEGSYRGCCDCSLGCAVPYYKC